MHDITSTLPVGVIDFLCSKTLTTGRSKHSLLISSLVTITCYLQLVPHDGHQVWWVRDTLAMIRVANAHCAVLLDGKHLIQQCVCSYSHIPIFGLRCFPE